MKLTNAKMIAMVAVSDINKAKEFYGGTLGLTQSEENPAGVGYTAGSGNLFVYVSDSAGSSKSTSVSWSVEDLDAVVQELKANGVSQFEHYNIPNATWHDDVATMGAMKAAWFHDPDGNILGLSQL